MDNKKAFLIEQYGLKETAKQAFSDRTARQKQLQWWIDRTEEVEEWKKVLTDSASIDKNFLVFIIGSYGRGKTLSLLKVGAEAEKSKENYVNYLNFKGEEKSTPGLDFIFRILKSVDFTKLKSNRKSEEFREAINRIPKEMEEPIRIIKKICFGEQSKYKYQAFDSTKESRNSKNALENLALFFLRGEISPTIAQLKQLQVIRRINQIDVAKEYLGAILCFLRNLGYKSLVLTIDEFEYLFSLVPKSQHSIYVALLRSLYDFPIGLKLKKSEIVNLILFIAISEDGWSSLKEMEKREAVMGGPTTPLLERVDVSTTLAVFDKTQTRELIVKRLHFNRATNKFEDQSLLPYTEDFVDFIYEATLGEPRLVITRCGHVLDAGIAERVPKLDKKFAERVLAERGL